MTEPATIHELLRERAQSQPDVEAFIDGSRRITFGQWDAMADTVASRFAEEGVGQGDVVCLQLPSSIGYAVCYQAASRLGAITSGINPRLGPSEVGSIVERTAPVATITNGEEVESLLAEPAVPSRVAVAATDPVAIVSTSGTTGVPKGAVFDHECLRAMAGGAGILSRPGDRRLSPLPFAHVGYMTRPWDEIANGITTVIVPTPWRAPEALRLIEVERVTVGQGVPAQWALMLAAPEFESTDVSSLRL